MAEPAGFLKYDRREVPSRPVQERVNDYAEVEVPHPQGALVDQAARCMDCGIPFCHAHCPLNNRIPEWNELVYQGKWDEAIENLHSTNNFPEITGRVCPAPCEAACTLTINSEPVLIKHIEYQIAERALAEGGLRPMPPAHSSGRRVAIVGSGPAGLAAAQQLRRAGHEVVVFEKDDRVGGLLRYGIPDFKFEKRILDQRLEQLRAEGVRFETGVSVGEDLSPRYLRRSFDATCLAMGAGQPRPLAASGAGFENVHFAMEYLTQQNRVLAGDSLQPGQRINARNQIAVIIGGGDTGSDCVGTAIRQGATEVHQFEILPQPPPGRNPATPWPMWPLVMRSSSSQEEGCRRRWGVWTKGLSGTGINATELHAVEVDWLPSPRGPRMKERPGTEFSMRVDLVLLAMGFLHVAHTGLVEQLGLKLDDRGGIAVRNHMTSEKGVFAAGDSVMGASLVVHAINTGRRAATSIDRWLGTGRWVTRSVPPRPNTP